MNTKIYFFLGVIFPFFALAQNKTIYVSASANGLNDGSSWQNAFTNLQNALQKAQKSDALWIAKGTYFPTQNTDRTISFDLKNGVHVFGGFQGNETSLSQRDFDKNKTILSGNIGNPKDSLDNVYRVVSAMDISTPTFLDGVEITGGRADTDLFLTSKDKGLNGGGLCVAVTNASALSKITVRNCKFYNNYAGLRGGGLYFDSQYSGNIAIVVKNCHFYNNIAFFGAGMAIGDADPSTMLVDSCSFVHNQGLLFTAGLYIEVSVGKGFVANIKNCLFRENWSKLSTEGISMSQTCLIPNSVFYMDFNNCTFDREVNNYDIIYTFSGPPDSRIDAKFTKCKFMNFYDGVINISGNLSIDQCLFYKIKYNCIQQGNLIQLDNSIFYETGGVINYYKNSSITNFKNNIFVKNKHLFGKIIAKGNTTFSNSIFLQNLWYPMADSVLATIKIKNSLVDSSSIFTSIIKKTITCDSCLYNLNPLFVDTAKLDFHLLPCSPAINVGNNAYAAGLKTDFEGKSRVFYDKIDLGAYEYNGFDVPSFSANATICESKQGSFLPVLKENCSNIPTINWTNDKNESGTGGNNLGQGTYTFIVKDSNQCTDTIKNVKIQSKGSIGIGFVKTDVSSATAKNGTITITDVPNGKAPIQYLWSTGDTTNQVKNLAVGIYGISIVDANGCKFSTTIQMSATTSVSELSGFFDVQLSPNPVSDYLILTVFGKMEEKVNVEVFTLEGRLIYTFESDKPTFGLDVQSYQQGLYLVKIKNNQGEFVKKFMKK